ncbi:esterase/lipase family protein [Methylophaga sp.]|uniref:esterase/lipase family protein n=1 Tax=Methylophaga sp. TaxID=2024840 RepID=UPI003F6A4D70
MKQHVILLHGLARTSRSMRRLASSLRKAGFTVDNCRYPSRQLSIEELSESVISSALKRSSESDKVHFVTHSLGGIVFRDYLNRHKIVNLGRVVMLAPPNQGSEVVDKLRRWSLFKWFNGPAGQQLGTRYSDRPRQLPSADYELGVIAGTRSINCYLSTLLPSPNDGKVSVASTQLEGMKRHLTVGASHSFIMQNKTVIEQTVRFIQQGDFS